jgi:hypothetical protein
LVLLAVLAIGGIAADYKWTGQCTQCGKEYRQNNPPVLARIPAGANRGRP